MSVLSLSERRFVFSRDCFCISLSLAAVSFHDGFVAGGSNDGPPWQGSTKHVQGCITTTTHPATAPSPASHAPSHEDANQPMHRTAVASTAVGAGTPVTPHSPLD